MRKARVIVAIPSWWGSVAWIVTRGLVGGHVCREGWVGLRAVQLSRTRVIVAIPSWWSIREWIAE